MNYAMMRMMRTEDVTPQELRYREAMESRIREGANMKMPTLDTGTIVSIDGAMGPHILACEDEDGTWEAVGFDGKTVSVEVGEIRAVYLHMETALEVNYQDAARRGAYDMLERIPISTDVTASCKYREIWRRITPPTKEMTLSEIEKKLGHPVKIVKD